MTTDPFDLSGKRVLVTGASSGIGKCAATACAERGAKLIISGRDPDRLRVVLESLSGAGHASFTADLTDVEQRNALADHCAEIDGLFYSAGITAAAPFRMISAKHIQQLMSIDFEAPVLLVQRLLYRKQVKRGGSIVFNTAGAARNSPKGAAIYSAAKAALTAAARTLALEVARDKIRVNCLQLGYVRTELLDRVSESGTDMQERADLTPLGIGDVEDAAYATVFLLSDASRWISRTTLTADGGISIRISA